jgi:hypothetical protein
VSVAASARGASLRRLSARVASAGVLGLSLGATLLSSGCGGGASSGVGAAVAGGLEEAPVVEVPLRPGELRPVAGRVEQVEPLPEPLLAWLRALLAAPGEVQDGFVDWERVEHVRAAAAASFGPGAPPPERGHLGVSLPEGCEPAFERREGASQIVLPPPMLGRDAETDAIVRRGADALREGSEIRVLCLFARLDESAGEPRRVVESRPVAVLSVVPLEQQWRVQAFAAMNGHDDVVSP